MAERSSDPTPWEPLRRPSGVEPVSGIRVDSTHPWNLYWALDAGGRQLLVMSHSDPKADSLRLPRVSGLELSHGQSSGASGELLILRLTEPSLVDIFQRLCLDIIDSTRACNSESEAVTVFVRRTWRWHHLLRGGGASRLSREQQMGLLGELAILERFVLPHVVTAAAVEGWLGPEREPKDFVVGRVCIEAKAHGPSVRDEVRISSIDQLSRDGLSALFLCVTGVATAPDPQSGVTVSDVADQLRSRIEGSDPAALGVFDAKLAAFGLDAAHDYSDQRWIVGETVVYEVLPDFPRIEPSEVTSAILRLRYVLRLSDCEEFIVDPDRLVAALSAESLHD